MSDNRSDRFRTGLLYTLSLDNAVSYRSPTPCLISFIFCFTGDDEGFGSIALTSCCVFACYRLRQIQVFTPKTSGKAKT